MSSPVGRVLEELVQLAPAQRVDERRDFDHPVVERRQRPVEGVVGLVLGAVEFQDGLAQVYRRLPTWLRSGIASAMISACSVRIRAKSLAGAVASFSW